MNPNIPAFLQRMQEDESFQGKAKDAVKALLSGSPQALEDLAKEVDLPFEAQEFFAVLHSYEQQTAELADDDLGTIAGGMFDKAVGISLDHIEKSMDAVLADMRNSNVSLRGHVQAAAEGLNKQLTERLQAARSGLR